MKRFSSFLALAALPACTGTVIIGELAADAGLDTQDSANGPTLEIHLRASAAPFAHTDGYSGETPRKASVGIRSLRLGSGPTDPTPLVVFDKGASYVEAGTNDGDDTIVATVPVATLRAGSYSWAKIGVSHVRYQIDATMHNGVDVPGVFDNVQVLSNGTALDGQIHDSGWYTFKFVAGGLTLGMVSGANGPVPTYPTASQIALVIEGGAAFYSFPIATAVDPGLSTDWRVVLEINVDRDFRWEDTAGAGHAAGVFDTEPAAFEPVRRFGANTFVVRAEMK